MIQLSNKVTLLMSFHVDSVFTQPTNHCTARLAPTSRSPRDHRHYNPFLIARMTGISCHDFLAGRRETSNRTKQNGRYNRQKLCVRQGQRGILAIFPRRSHVRKVEQTIRGSLIVGATVLALNGSSMVSGQTSDQGSTSVDPCTEIVATSHQNPFPSQCRVQASRCRAAYNDQSTTDVKNNSKAQTEKRDRHPHSSTAGNSQIPPPRSGESFLDTETNRPQLCTDRLPERRVTLSTFDGKGRRDPVVRSSCRLTGR